VHGVATVHRQNCTARSAKHKDVKEIERARMEVYIHAFLTLALRAMGGQFKEGQQCCFVFGSPSDRTSASGSETSTGIFRDLPQSTQEASGTVNPDRLTGLPAASLTIRYSLNRRNTMCGSNKWSLNFTSLFTYVTTNCYYKFLFRGKPNGSRRSECCVI
jgi:hypothetical protein